MERLTVTPEMRGHLKDALYHMTAMWDALSALETEDMEVNEDDISGPASDLREPGDAYRLSDSAVDEIVDGLMVVDSPEVTA